MNGWKSGIMTPEKRRRANLSQRREPSAASRGVRVKVKRGHTSRAV
jgi:hypothetical protein